MEFKAVKEDDVVIYSISGRLDSNTCTDFERALLATIDEGEEFFVLDFANLDYISSAGLRVLLVATKKLSNTEGKIVLANVKEDIQEVFDIAGLSAYYKIYGSVDEALDNIFNM